MRSFQVLTARTVLFAAVSLGVLLLGGCRSGATKAPHVPTTTAAVVPQPPVESGSSSASERTRPVPPLPEKDTVVVIDSGGHEGNKAPATLLEASKAEEQRRADRAKQGSHPIVITNKNLKSYATGKLTTAKPSNERGETASAAEGKEESDKAAKHAPPGPPSADAPGAEQYWQGRVLKIRQQWHDAVAKEHTLKGKIAALRRKFYAADDPYYRDSQIKPAWDKALADLDVARQEAKDAQDQLATALEEGRKAGAPAGWLRAGIDLEPKPVPKERHEPKTAPEPGQPQVVEPNGGPPVLLD